MMQDSNALQVNFEGPGSRACNSMREKASDRVQVEEREHEVVVQVVVEHGFSVGQEIVDQRVGEDIASFAIDDFGCAFGNVGEPERGWPSDASAEVGVVAEPVATRTRYRQRARNHVVGSKPGLGSRALLS